MIITIVANGAWKKGDYVSYEKHTKTAFVFLVIGWVLLGIFAFVVLGGFAYLFYSMVTSGF
ncbi:hypothetical protein [Butyrivibrio sp. CB08]|uniref:hypothetical protein n=1 Tax=Butyrivibrio sp. CB08 TaxID=2364879 RepID=UPI0011C23E8F|nr:hypothetical protein [Butyrivibrio sp. CB08]